MQTHCSYKCVKRVSIFKRHTIFSFNFSFSESKETNSKFHITVMWPLRTDMYNSGELHCFHICSLNTLKLWHKTLHSCVLTRNITSVPGNRVLVESLIWFFGFWPMCILTQKTDKIQTGKLILVSTPRSFLYPSTISFLQVRCKALIIHCE